MVPRVDYLGYRIDKEGLPPIPDKVSAIMETPKLRAFLGLVNNYEWFLSQSAMITQPLNNL